MKNIFNLLFFLTFSILTHAREIHVSKNGNDINNGTKGSPYKTISKAASIALSGDIVIVHQGTYREHVNPIHSGLNNLKRIIYKAAENETVWIKGSEVINTWVHHKNNVWKAVLDNKMFNDFNPYKEIVEGDWVVNTYDRIHHLGEVYLNGEALYEIDKLDDVSSEEVLERTRFPEASKRKWYCESNEKTTTIYANFKGVNPNKEMVEINVRPTVFYPKAIGVNYITVSGFNLSHAATQWSPPTSEQVGLIGPNWSKGWIIENNKISDSKNVGICIGKEKGSGHNLWTNLKTKHGTQREREVIFKALQMGWSKETIGSHIIRNNTIKNCEQAGIVGHLGCVFSEIYNNHIYNIHVKQQYFGYEVGAIKLHAPIDVIIRNNNLHTNFRGIWLDWQAQGTRVTQNLFYDNSDADFFIEVSHGPLLVDNNILLSSRSIIDAAQGSAFIHNLFAGIITPRTALDRVTPYHFPHSTQVAGLISTVMGDNRYYNNIFTSKEANLNGPISYNGLNAYNDFPDSSYKWEFLKRNTDYNNQKLPMFIDANLYLNNATPSNIDENAIVNRDLDSKIKVSEENDGVYITIFVDDSFKNTKTTHIDTKRLGVCHQTEVLYEAPDGKEISINIDYLGRNRDNASPMVGPLENLIIGENRIKVWSK